MLNFSIKTPKTQLHQSFEMVKFLAYCYSELVLIQAHCSLNCKKKKKVFYSHDFLSFFSSFFSFLSPFALLSPNGCDPAMVLVQWWFWFDNGGLIVMGSMWSDGLLWYDGLPLFSLLSLYSLFFVLSSWVWWSPSILSSLPLFSLLCSFFVGLMVSLYLSSLRWSLPPCWIQWCWFILLFLLSYSIFFVNTTLCLVSQKMEGKKNQNWKLRY